MIGAITRSRSAVAACSASSPRQPAVQRSNIPLAATARAETPCRVGRSDERRNTTVSTVRRPRKVRSMM
jgi:hypothetical protein